MQIPVLHEVMQVYFRECKIYWTRRPKVDLQVSLRVLKEQKKTDCYSFHHRNLRLLQEGEAGTHSLPCPNPFFIRNFY